MTTSQDETKTPGTLKAALTLWMILIGSLLGYSIATAEDAPVEGHAPLESSETTEGEPADAGQEPAASPAASDGPATESIPPSPGH